MLNNEIVKQVFDQYGTVVRCKHLTGKLGCKDAALVEYSTVEEANAVKQLLDGFIPQGLIEPVAIKVCDKGQGKGKDKDKSPSAFTPYNAAPVAATFGGVAPGTNGASDGTGNSMSDQICAALDKSGALPGGTSFVNEDSQLFVGSLPSCCTNYHLYRMFSSFGPIAPNGVRVMVDATGQCSGYGFVNFLVQTSGQVAIQTMNGMLMPDGQALAVQVKRPGKGKGPGKGISPY